MGDNFYENLRTARERKGMTQKEVADAIGVAKSTYSLYESGNRGLNVMLIKKLANVLKVSADELLGIDDSQSTMAAHFDGKEFTAEELDKIREFAAFVKTSRK